MTMKIWGRLACVQTCNLADCEAIQDNGTVPGV